MNEMNKNKGNKINEKGNMSAIVKEKEIIRE